MKIKIKSFNAVAAWKWNIKPDAKDGQQQVDEDEEDDVCGICQNAFEGCCPNCKVPGDDCPLIFGQCTHIVKQQGAVVNNVCLTLASLQFHLHCLLTWLNAESSKNQCPMDRQTWVTKGG